MSVISSIFIFLLCHSMHACSARHFGVVRSTTPFHFSTKGLEKVKLNFDSIQELNEDGIVDKSHGGAITQELKDSKALLKELKHTRREISGLAPIKPLVSVSWHVPHKKNNDNPWFHSDYSQPRTRTPSHN